MHIGFIIANWNTIDPANSSTLSVIRECLIRGHKVSILYTDNLTVRNNVVHGFIETICVMDKIPENITTFYKKVTFNKSLKALHVFDCMMIRKDPPINPLVLNFLDAIKDEDSRAANELMASHLDAIRKLVMSSNVHKEE